MDVENKIAETRYEEKNMNTIIIIVGLWFSLSLAICLYKGIAKDTRYESARWWKRTVMFVISAVGVAVLCGILYVCDTYMSDKSTATATYVVSLITSFIVMLNLVPLITLCVITPFVDDYIY